MGVDRVGSSEEYDVAVAGGGPAGAIAALVLARAGRRVLLLDKSKPGEFKIGEGLPPAAMPLLRDLGLLDGFLREGHHPSYGNLSAWGSPHLQSTDFIFDPNGHGWRLDRGRFDAFLRQQARSAGAQLCEQASLVRVAREDGPPLWHLVIRGPDGAMQSRARWLVDATGRRCFVARQQGARPIAYDSLTALYALFSQGEGHAPDEDSRTLIESCSGGWWYTALLPSKRRVAVYHTDADLLPQAGPVSPAAFKALLEATGQVCLRIRAYGYEMEGAPRAAPAQSARLERFAGDGWLAVGDAALSFDPLSSQGIMTALFAGMEAGGALNAHLSGDPLALDAYTARLTAIYDAYLRNRFLFYNFERRWAGEPFWRRRAEATRVSSASLAAHLP